VSRRRLILIAGLVAGLCVLAAAVFVWARGGTSSSTARAQSPIEARTILSPPSALFGDTVTAVVEVTLDRSRVDPGSVRVRTEFSPWKLVTKPERFRQDSKTSTYLRTTFAVRCLDAPCLPSANTTFASFPPARVTYTPKSAAAGGARSSLTVPWPQLVLDSRDVTRPGTRASATPWKADLLSLPGVTYGTTPVVLFTLLLAAATLLAIAGVALAIRALPRDAEQIPVLTEQPSVPTPIEQAFVLLEDGARVNGVADRRRALQLVAEMLFERGDLDLARAARTLAWSEAAPATDATSTFAATARSALGEEERG